MSLRMTYNSRSANCCVRNADDEAVGMLPGRTQCFEPAIGM